MKLYEKLPEGVRVDGKFYRLDFDFRNVLRMMEVLQRDDLMQDAREYLAIKCLTRKPKNCGKVLAAVRALLFGETHENSDGQKVTSFEQDAVLIRAAFRQSYGIDLYRDKLHWLEFMELLQAIPEGNRYAEVIGIRTRPMPKATKYNAEERKWLMDAKSRVAIHMTEAEAARKYDSDISKIFAGLLKIAEAPGGSESNNGG